MEEPLYPDLLVRKNLEAPFGAASTQLAAILRAAERLEGNSVELRGLVVLAVAAVETAFLDALAYYYVARPESIELAEATFSRSELLEARAPLDLILVQAARSIRRLGYGPFSSILSRFARTTKLQTLPAMVSEEVLDFEQLKDARNRIVHAQADPNTALLERPVQGRSSTVEPRLNGDWLARRTESAQVLLGRVLEETAMTYGEYSRIAALQRLWYWMFDSPLMAFERFWVVDEAKDEIVGATGVEKEVPLSGGESILHSVWLAHFNQSVGDRPLSMYSLDTDNQRKVLHLLAMTDRFRMY